MFNLGNITFIIADNEELKKEIYKLRYDVYVTEFGFEKPEDHLDGYEMDMFDENSIHFAAIDRQTGQVVGSMRLVLDSQHGFPIEDVDGVSFDDKESRKHTVEISRFAVRKEYRRQREDIFFRDDSGSKAKEGLGNSGRPVVIYGLFRLLYQTSKKMGLTNWTMISEKKLHRALSLMGFRFNAIGPEVEYHGKRTPYLASLDDMEQFWVDKMPDFILFQAEGLEEQFLPKFPEFNALLNESNSQQVSKAA